MRLKTHNMNKLLLVIAIAWLAGTPVSADPPADLVLHGFVWTAETTRPWAEAIAIQGTKVVAVGSRASMSDWVGADTEVIQADQALIVPGWIDAHVHLLDGGANLNSVQLRDATTQELFVQRIAEYAARTPPGTWITGGDWDHTLWGGDLPDRAWIDAATPQHPVWLQRLDGHMALANSAAIRAAGVRDDVDDVPGGEIVRDRDGVPTGIFKDNAMSLINRAVPPPTLEQQLEAIVAAVDYLAARGVTTVHHMGSWEDLAALRVAEQRNLLKIRVYAFTPLAQWRRLADEVQQHGRGTPMLRIGGLKGFVDGSLGSRTAAFLRPFEGSTSDRGLLVNSVDDLYDWTKAADAAGLQVAVHAIGDRAIRLQLDIFERVTQENPSRDRRFRIEHAQHIHPDDIARFAALGVIASMQPYHAIDDGRWAEAVIGSERSATTYAFRSLLDSGAQLAFGSDWFVAPPSPLAGMYAAVTRRTLDGKHPDGWTPAQKITVDEALRGYTVGAAVAGAMEQELGTLTPGKQADLVILDRNLFTLPPKQLREVSVQRTIVAGKTVYMP